MTSETPASEPVLVARGITKSFGGALALRGASLAIEAGESHALLGENGAGKSTLVRILAGVLAPDQGELRLAGHPVRFRGPAEAQAAGISVIYQEPSLFPDLSIAENVLIGHMPRARFGTIDRAAAASRVAGMLGDLGVPLPPRRPVRGLSIAAQQVVEIAKALSNRARVLIMDEPTAALTTEECERLFAVVRSLRARGVAVLFITHRLEEAFAECQRFTILRDGALAASGPREAFAPAEVVRRMVGRPLDQLYPQRSSRTGDELLAVTDLTRAGSYEDVHFRVRAGEIVALAGLVGAGRSEVLRGIFGIDPRDRGSVRVAGCVVAPADPRAAMRAGLALVPEDRRQQGLVLALSIIRNATLAVPRAVRRFGLVSRRREGAVTRLWAARLQLKAHRLSDPVGTLSGGNQQKVVLGKWLATAPRVLLIDEPTRGIDVGAKAELHRRLAELRDHGLAIVMVSSDLPEVLGMADRILVMREGRLVGELRGADATGETVMLHATGQQDGARALAAVPA